MALLRFTCLYLLINFSGPVFSQAKQGAVTRAEVSRVMKVLADDSLRGRGNLQPGLLKAAKFIGAEFQRTGLVPLSGRSSFFIPFRPVGGKKNEPVDLLDWNGKQKASADFTYFHQDPGNYPDRPASYFEIRQVEAFDDSTLLRIAGDSTPLLLWTSSLPDKKKRVDGIPFIMPVQGLRRDLLLVIADTIPSSFTLRGNDIYYRTLEYNIAGRIPGRSAEELMFSSHYDHEGVMPGQRRDSIMNGANDNASGTAAVMTLARWFATGAQPERTLVFTCFAAEELGMIGSTDFATTRNLNNLVGVINLEMLGIAQFGERTVIITGEYDSELPTLLKEQLRLQGLKVIKDRRLDSKLYERSDNYPFALRDIPAHTVMGSNDEDECYHQFCDEYKRIDIPNLTSIINAVAHAVKPFVSGEIKREKIK